MRKLLVLFIILFSAGYVIGQEGKLLKRAMADDTESTYLLDSIYVYTNSGFLSAKQYSYYNDENLNVHNLLYGYSEWSSAISYNMDSIYYDADGNKIQYTTFALEAGEWLPSNRTYYTYNSSGKLTKEEEYKFDLDVEKWGVNMVHEYYYDVQGNLIEVIRYSTDFNGNFGPNLKTEYSDFIAEDKPEKATLYTYNNEGVTTISAYQNYEYDERNNLLSQEYISVNSEGTETKMSLEEWKYNTLNQVTEYMISYTNWPDYDVYTPQRKTENEYDENNNLVKDKNSYYSSYNETWTLSTEMHYFWSEVKEPEPLASIGSNWKYWMARERTFGFHKYEVVKDTVITAPLFGTDRIITATASLIQKSTYQSMQGSTNPGEPYEAGTFAAYRQGNKSYVWDKNTKEWFLWVDMDAKPGDKWIVPEIISGKGVHDYVEVSFVTTMEIDGKTVPYIYLIPACESQYTQSRDFTSRLNMSGYWNIDYWSLYTSPEPRPNGYIYTNNGAQEEVTVGLICAKVNGEDFATENLEEYVYYNNPTEYENNIIDCDELKSPYSAPEQRSAKRMFHKPEYAKENNHIIDFQKIIAPEIEGTSTKRVAQRSLQSKADLAPTDVIKIPVVVHVVHNPETPEEKITSAQVDKMIQALNDAYSKTHPDRVRDIFKGVIGNPYVEFELAKRDPSGKATNGIVYYETDKDYFDLPTWYGIEERYAFKFNEDGTGRNWDHTKYANIYVVDLGGMDGYTNTGGFVTNPEYNTDEEFEMYKKWIAEGNPEFWDNWLQSEEATLLDGLTVDTWYTFGGASEKNPNANFATAIHELGHYLGLRHVSLTIIQNSNGSIEPYDDGFSDTPYTHYNQYALVPCGQDIYQCGNLVQTENYMDYSLDCAAMFTIQQSAFMRDFVQEVRPNLFSTEGGNPGPGTDIKDVNTDNIVIYPNPAKDYIHIEGEFKSARIMDATGRLVMTVPANQNTVYLNNFNPGIYFVMTELENGKNIINKIIIEVVK